MTPTRPLSLNSDSPHSPDESSDEPTHTPTHHDLSTLANISLTPSPTSHWSISPPTSPSPSTGRTCLPYVHDPSPSPSSPPHLNLTPATPPHHHDTTLTHLSPQGTPSARLGYLEATVASLNTRVALLEEANHDLAGRLGEALDTADSLEEELRRLMPLIPLARAVGEGMDVVAVLEGVARGMQRAEGVVGLETLENEYAGAAGIGEWRENGWDGYVVEQTGEGSEGSDSRKSTEDF